MVNENVTVKLYGRAWVVDGVDAYLDILGWANRKEIGVF